VSDLFYVPHGNVIEGRVAFTAGESAHILKSCRKGIGDQIRATDGRGRWMTILVTGTRKAVTGRILDSWMSEPEPYRMDVAAGVSKQERMSWLIEKGTEIGMTTLTPVTTSWSRAQRSREDWEDRLARWRRVSVAALKQSHRPYLPDIRSPLSLERFLDSVRSDPYDLKVLLDRGEGSRSIGSLLEEGMRRFLILLGPEGGFDGSEVSRIVERGFLRARIIDRSLRFETAGIAAMAAIAMRFAGEVDR